MPVALQEGVHVAAVPRGLLRFENSTDRIAVGRILIRGIGEYMPVRKEKRAHCQ